MAHHIRNQKASPQAAFSRRLGLRKGAAAASQMENTAADIVLRKPFNLMRFSKVSMAQNYAKLILTCLNSFFLAEAAAGAAGLAAQHVGHLSLLPR